MAHHRNLFPRPVRAAMRIAGGVAALLAFVAVLVANPSCTPTPVPSETAGADAGRLRLDVEALCGTKVPRSVARPEGLAEAEGFLRKSWEAMGLPVRVDELTVDGRTYRNSSVLFGDAKAPRVVVGAHYDVYGELPGADDNASGVAAVLELSRRLLAKPPTVEHAIELVAWTNEEPPFFGTEHMGSLLHARRLKREGVPVKLAVSIEMIGSYSDVPGSQHYPMAAMRLLYPSRGNFLAIVGQASPSAWWLVRRAKAAASTFGDLPLRSINAPAFVPGVDFSDHRSFWQEGIPALMVTDTSFYRNDRYHTARDTPDTLDYERMAKAVDAVYGIAVGL